MGTQEWERRPGHNKIFTFLVASDIVCPVTGLRLRSMGSQTEIKTHTDEYFLFVCVCVCVLFFLELALPEDSLFQKSIQEKHLSLGCFLVKIPPNF